MRNRWFDGLVLVLSLLLFGVLVAASPQLRSLGFRGVLAGLALLALLNGPMIIRIGKGANAAPFARVGCAVGTTFAVNYAFFFVGTGSLFRAADQMLLIVGCCWMVALIQILAAPFSRVTDSGFQWSMEWRRRFHSAGIAGAGLLALQLPLLFSITRSILSAPALVYVLLTLLLTFGLLARRAACESLRIANVRSIGLAVLGVVACALFGLPSVILGGPGPLDFIIRSNLFIAAIGALEGAGTPSMRSGQRRPH